ncbi:hypothetical protein NEOLEDRAFT_119565 [Neolentinus lepideus HHB14362 ss-1]|uniref:Uncharacterized protein n=1 Tax=Neolentinus lepideus HHB14362 ss-1 TaxID=1314782 RepID=A0A165MU71_9AGAM|nr:hypothetical protein NEOLEDRAFT_119565 [Neolentinus lepideus HHB14362 ss-1]
MIHNLFWQATERGSRAPRENVYALMTQFAIATFMVATLIANTIRQPEYVEMDSGTSNIVADPLSQPSRGLSRSMAVHGHVDRIYHIRIPAADRGPPGAQCSKSVNEYFLQRLRACHFRARTCIYNQCQLGLPGQVNTAE